MSDRFNWPVLLGAGLYGLRLQPAQFWALTPAELSLMLGAGARPAMSRSRLNQLARLWPDAGPNVRPNAEPDVEPDVRPDTEQDFRPEAERGFGP
jgi:uncharacterized phage protein (TIGR02216 family)